MMQSVCTRSLALLLLAQVFMAPAWAEAWSTAGLAARTTLRVTERPAAATGLGSGLTIERSQPLGSQPEPAALAGVLTHEWREGTRLVANLGWLQRQRHGHHRTSWSLGVERDLGPLWSADVFGDKAHRPWVTASAGWSLLERFSFNAVAAQPIERKRVRQLSVAVKLQF